MAFADEAARLIIRGRDPSTLDQPKAQLGADTIAVRNDAGRIADGVALADTLKQHGVKLDVVFINADVTQLAALEAVKENVW